MLDQIGEKFHGFTVKNIRENEELGGRLVELVYDKTGTELCWVDNGETNKLFSIAFKTVPENSTGVFHILEHSVLCGSKKFPVREPFVELLKSSMNTFLNAMTFPDKTMYPVSSRNGKDFLNLTEVYLDAVFAPAILENPNIFYQEGWHLEEADGKLSYKGVVFNEMKGAMSGVDRIVEEELMEQIFPDTCYGFNSGGDPVVIPDLTYENFKETYLRFYHPSNAKIFLDGAVPVEETFALLEEYLSGYEKSDALPVIALQKPVFAEKTCTFELSPEEELENKGHLAFGKIVGDWEDRRKNLAAQVLLDAVAGSNEAPLKRAVLSSGLALEMDTVMETVAQSFLMVQLKNVKDGKEGELLSLIRSTAKELAQNGLDRAALEASANRLEYNERDLDEPQGLERAINAMNSWLYGGDPMQYLVCKDDYNAVRDMIRSGEMEKILEELFVSEEGVAVLHAVPSHDFGKILREEEEKRLENIAASWQEKDWAENHALCEKLLTWQQTPDTQAQLSTIPTLDLSEVSRDVEFVETKETEVEGVKVLYHPVKTGGIVHLSLYFDLTDRTLEELSLIDYAGVFLGQIGTKQYSSLALQQELKNVVGRFSPFVSVNSKRGQTKECTPRFEVKCSVLEEKLDQALALIREILLETDLSQEEQIREILKQTDEQNKQVAIYSGHALCMISARSHYSASGAVQDALQGYSAVRALRDLMQAEERFPAFLQLMKNLVENSFVSSRLTVSVTAEKEMDVSSLIRSLPVGTAVAPAATYVSPLPEKMGCKIPARIGFSAQAYHLDRMGQKIDGSMQVAANLTSLNLMWNTVRVQGGAYGTGLNLRLNGGVSTYSFRDPTPVASLGVNGKISDFIREFCQSDEELDKYIISTVAATEPLRSSYAKGHSADYDWFSGYTREDMIREREQMLATTREKLLESIPVWDEFAEKGAVCVVGFDEMLEERADLTILPL